MERKTKKIAFGRNGAWGSLVAGSIDREAYAFSCVDFDAFDLRAADYAVPLQVHEAMSLRRQYGEEHEKYLIPEAHITALCADKLDFNKAILASAFARMIPPISDPTKPNFPDVVKNRHGASGAGIFVVQDEQDERRYADHASREGCFCQAYVPGQIEYATHILLVESEVLYHSTNKYVMPDEFLVKGSAHQPAQEMLGTAMEGRVIGELTD